MTCRCCADLWIKSRRSAWPARSLSWLAWARLRSAKTAEWMRKNVPGMHVPDSVIERLRGAKDQATEGRNICVDLIQSISAMRGVSGVHIMAYRQEESVADIVDRSGLLKERAPWYPERDSSQNSHRTTS